MSRGEQRRTEAHTAGRKVTLPWLTTSLNNLIAHPPHAELSELSRSWKNSLGFYSGEVKFPVRPPACAACRVFDAVVSRREKRGEGLVVASQRRDV